MILDSYLVPPLLFCRFKNKYFQKKDPRRVPYKYIIEDLTEFLAKNSNIGKSDEEMTQVSEINKLPCDEDFTKEKMSSYDENKRWRSYFLWIIR